MPVEWRDFLQNFEARFDKKKQTGCDYHKCDQRLFANQIQIFTMPDGSPKIFCFEHLLATLMRFDKQKFEQIIDTRYPKHERGAIKMYFQERYLNQN